MRSRFKKADAECGAIRAESSGTYSYPVAFVVDDAGMWKITGL